MRTSSFALFLFVFAGSTLAQTPPTVFGAATSKAGGVNAARKADPSVRRARAVSVDASMFDSKAAKQLLRTGRKSVLFNLFADRSFTVTLEEITRPANDRKTIVWTGKVDGHPMGHAVVVASDGRFTGNVSAGDGLIYQIRPDAEGGHSIFEVDTRTFQRELEPRRQQGHDELPSTVPQGDSDGTTVDVMVVYSPAARAAAGGEAEMRQLIQLGIAETNQGYANSGLPQRLRLAATGEVNYQETGDLEKDLDNLTNDGDGLLDEVHRVRDAAGADLVSLWVEQGGGCGIGWMLGDPGRPSPQLGFNVVRRNCATGYFSFGHELGHNMGAMHAREDGGGEGAFAFSHGYKHVASGQSFRCIMSYDCAGAGCDRVNLWSSPEVKYRGVPVGDSSTDNRLTLLRTAEIVAGYRKSTQGAPAPPVGNSKGYPESAHPYSDDTDRTWTYTLPGNPSGIYVSFDNNTYVEEDYDWIVVTDANGREVEGSPFTGAALAGRTLRVAGDTVRIRLVTDDSITEYGFAVSNVAPANGGRVDLVATSFSAPSTGVIGARMDGVVSVVRNDGAEAAPAFRIGYYLFSAAQEITFTGWGCQVAGLAPGQTYTCGGGIVVPASLKPGEYVLVVVADDLEQTGDENFGNNGKASSSGVVTLR